MPGQSQDEARVQLLAGVLFVVLLLELPDDLSKAKVASTQELPMKEGRGERRQHKRLSGCLLSTARPAASQAKPG